MANVNDVHGFNDKLCIECTNGNAKYPRQTIQYDNYRISQPAKCHSDLTLADKEFKPVVINYDGLQNQVGKTIAPSFTSFFKNDDAEHCPVRSCVLLNKGCLTKYTKANIKMSSTTPWTISVGDDVQNGYTDETCVQCTNGW